MITKIAITAVFLLSANCCETRSYVKGVQEDSRKIFERKKSFFKSFDFNGAVSKKKYCENCKVNKYQLIITLEMAETDTIELMNQYYPPYYFFEKRNQLNLSVTKDLYEPISEGQSVSKEKSSDFLNFGGKQYRVLSEKKNLWMPE